MAFWGKKADAEDEQEYQDTAAVEQDELPPEPGPDQINTTVVAFGATVVGTIRGRGVVKVKGTVEGEINLEDGAVLIEPGGLVKGPVTAGTISIAGTIEGVVNAVEHLIIKKTGSLQGDFTTVSLVVEDGGRLNGTATMPERGGKK